LRFKVSGAYAKGRTAKNKKMLAKEKTARLGTLKDTYGAMSCIKNEKRNGKKPIA
jgi:hypothetical protein